MEILKRLLQRIDEQDMPFLLIGGHAVNAYGISRQTGDIDLLVQRSRKHSWEQVLGTLNFIKDQDDENFVRFRPNTIAAWPIDLMLVDDSTFAKLAADSQTTTIGAVSLKVVSARHLVILKIHALKRFQEHRFAKDYNDLLMLLRLKELRIENSELKSLCERYATMELYKKITRDQEGG